MAMAEASTGACAKVSMLMQAMPAATSSNGASMRRRGTAPWSWRPSSVTTSGTMPTISEVGAIPAYCTPYASNT